MHTLFARARTTSTKNLPKTPHTHPTTQDPHTDEFGRVHSRSQGATTFAVAPAPMLTTISCKGYKCETERYPQTLIRTIRTSSICFANENGSNV